LDKHLGMNQVLRELISSASPWIEVTPRHTPKSATDRTRACRGSCHSVEGYSTVIATAFDAMPFATTSRVLGPVSIVPGTVKMVEPAVPGAIDMVL